MNHKRNAKALTQLVSEIKTVANDAEVNFDSDFPDGLGVVRSLRVEKPYGKAFHEALEIIDDPRIKSLSIKGRGKGAVLTVTAVDDIAADVITPFGLVGVVGILSEPEPLDEGGTTDETAGDKGDGSYDGFQTPFEGDD